MTNQFLEAYIDGEWAAALPPVGTFGAMRLHLARSGTVQELFQKLCSGEVTDGDLDKLVSRLMVDFRQGERFVHQLVLAGIAVALESRHTQYAGTFLRTLSAFRLEELRSAIGVAKECLHRRDQLMATDSAEFALTEPLINLHALIAIDHLQFSRASGQLRASKTELNECLS